MRNKTSLASRMRHRVVIESPVMTTDGAGGFTASWKKFAETWAEILPKSGREVLRDEQSVSPKKIIVTIRYLKGLSEKMRIVYGERIFSILNILNPYEENILLEIIAEEKMDL